MAHKGRPYKLQFRRDLSPVSNNRYGWPEGVSFSSSCLGGSVGSLLSDRHVKIINLLTDSQPPMVWNSESILIGGANYHYIVSIAEPRELSTTSMRLQVVRDIDGAILFDAETSPPDLGAVPYFLFADVATINVRTPEVHGTCGPQRFEWVALEYNSYNP